MLEQIKRFAKGKNHYYLLGVYSVQEKTQFEFLEIALKSDELKIIERHSFSKMEDSLIELLKKDYPLLLHFDGDNVISKSVENKQGYRNNLVFKMNSDEFYFYEYHQENQIYVSLTRKHFVDDLIAFFNGKDKLISHLSLGPFVVSQLFSTFKNTDLVYVNFHKLSLNNESLVAFEKTEERESFVTISEENFSQKEIALISTFLEFKRGAPNIQFDDEFLKNNKEEYKFRKRFKQMSAFSITFILLLLIVGHNILSSYTQSLGEKESQYSISQQTLLEVKELRDERELKEMILETSGVIDANYMTQYFVEIGDVVPESITIISMDVAPPLKKIKPSEKININTKIIDIIGESNKDEDFNTFIKALKSISWVKKIDIINYSKDKSNSKFLIKLKK